MGDTFSLLRSLSSTQVTLSIAPGETRIQEYFARAPGPHRASASWKPHESNESFASATVEFTGRDTDIFLSTATPQVRVTCHAFLQAEGEPSRPLERVQISLRPESKSNQGTGCMTGATGRVSPLLLPGRHQVERIVDLPPNSYVKAVRHGAQDILSSGIDASGNSVEIEILVRSDGGRVSGRVLDAKGGLVHDATVALVPEPELKPGAIFLKTGRTDQRGVFELGAIAPGMYRLHALAGPEFLSALDGGGTLVEIDAGAAKTLDLRFEDN
jgi:hypothetical protein